ncbi:hypothetical protein Q9966_004061 [Columba livia]|nr:hypothetical protein Q9966_004061 [Columba livia]
MAGVGGGKRRRNDLETKKRDGIPVLSNFWMATIRTIIPIKKETKQSMDFFCLRDYVNVFETQRYYLQSLQVNKIGSIMRIASQNHEVVEANGEVCGE